MLPNVANYILMANFSSGLEVPHVKPKSKEGLCWLALAYFDILFCAIIFHSQSTIPGSLPLLGSQLLHCVTTPKYYIWERFATSSDFAHKLMLVFEHT